MVRRTAQGFTLVELLATTVILVLLLAVGVPSFTGFVRNQRVKTASFDLFSSLVLARSEAIARNASVTLTPAGGNWANGWSITDADGTVLRDEGPLSSISVNGPSSIVYRPSGRLSGAVLAAFELTSTGEGVATRCIRVDLSGRPYSKAAAC